MPPKTLRQIFFWPVLIALLSLAGLVLALVYDDLCEQLALLAIAVPVLVAMVLYWGLPQPRRR